MLTPDGSPPASRRAREEVTPGRSSPASVEALGADSTGLTLHFSNELHQTPSSRPMQPRPLLSSTARPHSPHPQALRDVLRTTPSSLGSGRRGLLRTPGQALVHTPNGLPYNPFETDPDKMKGWILSPGVFATKAQNSQENSPFWSIDHMALMKPADIDEKALYKLPCGVDVEADERVQRAIDEFFSTNPQIVPSPWSGEGGRHRRHVLPQTPQTPGTVSEPRPAQGTRVVESVAQPDKHDVNCQTSLSLPVDFDLQTVLAKYYNPEPKDEVSADVLSTSSLRRKLFFHGEDTPPESAVDDKPDKASPVMETDGVPDNTCATPSCQPSSLLYSSSPLRSDHDTSVPSLRRCSTAPQLMASPQFSPISSWKRGRTPSGETDQADKILEATPTSGTGALLSSPGVSPILPDSCRSHLTPENLETEFPLTPTELHYPREREPGASCMEMDGSSGQPLACTPVASSGTPALEDNTEHQEVLKHSDLTHQMALLTSRQRSKERSREEDASSGLWMDVSMDDELSLSSSQTRATSYSHALSESDMFTQATSASSSFIKSERVSLHNSLSFPVFKKESTSEDRRQSGQPRQRSFVFKEILSGGESLLDEELLLHTS